MEKRKPHYNLSLIIAQMETIEAMNLTQSAIEGIRSAGMTRADAWEVIQKLTSANFYKSMTTFNSNRIWQDVYHAECRGKSFYVKFQQAGEYFVVSFKER